MTLCARGKSEGSGWLVNDAGKPPRRATTRRRAMHPTIVINGSNIVAARLSASETTGAIEATGRIKRATLSCRRLSTCPAFVRPVAASPRVASRRQNLSDPISRDLYLTDITARNSRISFHRRSEWYLITYLDTQLELNEKKMHTKKLSLQVSKLVERWQKFHCRY